MGEKRRFSCAALETCRTTWLPILLTLLLGAILRLAALDAVPPGLTHDEANNVVDAASVLGGARPFYFPVAQGKEPLYVYSAALVMALVGPTPFALRLTTALWGVVLIAATYAWARRAFGRSTALWTAAGLAVSFWGVSTSRVGLRAIALPVLLTAAVAVSRLTDARRPRRWEVVGAGLLLGLGLYTYLAARVTPLLLLLFGPYLLLVDRARWRQRWRGWLVILVVAALAALPLLLYLQAHPSAAIRVGQLDQPLRDLWGGNPRPLLDNVLAGLGALSWRGDGFIPYNIPGRPILDPPMSLLFAAGLLIALWRWREPAYGFALLWLVVGFFPALVTGVDAIHLRAIAAQPVTYLFPAIAIHQLLATAKSHARTLCWLLLLALFAWTTVHTARDYFFRWPNDRDVRVHYHVDLIAVGEAAAGWADDLPTAISARYPGEYHDPRLLQAELGGAAASLRWFDGQHGLLLPPAAARLVLPANVPLDAALWAAVEPAATLLETVPLRPDDLTPFLAVYRWSPPATRARLQASMAAAEQPPQLPVDVGGVLAFHGYRLEGWSGEPGSSFAVLTLWEVAAPLPAEREAVLFSQLLNDANQVVAQQDRLDVPSWDWREGDALLQIHHLTLPANLPPGRYALIAGAYTTPDRVAAVLAGHEPDPATPRLLLTVQGNPAGDHLLLEFLVIDSSP